MDIQEYIDKLRANPKTLRTIGKGAHCLALIDPESPNQVLLLESGKPGTGHEGGFDTSTDRTHARAITFARQYDQYIKSGVTAVTNHRKTPFIHSDLISSISPRNFGVPLPLYIGRDPQTGRDKIFFGYSARLIRRIPGKAMDYLDFFDDGRRHKGHKHHGERPDIDAIARDLALWLFTLHHQISPGAMVGNKVEKQFSDQGRLMTTRVLNSEKFRVFVDQNVAEIRKLKEGLNAGTMHQQFREKLVNNMREAGIHFGLLVETAEAISCCLRKTLPNDRIGLTHSDVHPANVIVTPDYDAVTGICDWMSGGIDAQSVDFAGLGLAQGLLPRVVREYKKLEDGGRVSQKINYEAVYGYAVMRQLFVAVKAIKNNFGDGCTANIAWRQVCENVVSLARINSKFSPLARKLKHQSFMPVRIPETRKPFASHPTQAGPTAKPA